MTPRIICFCLFVMGVYETLPRMAASPAVDTGWQPGKLYEYEVQGSAYATLPQLGDQATGVEVRARLFLQRSHAPAHAHAHAAGRREIVAWVESARVAERRRVTRPEGTAPPPDARLHFQPLPLHRGAWTLRLSEHGEGSLLVNASLAWSEVNFIKALASRLVVNTGETKTEDDRPDVEFTVMEESVTGRCSTEYAVSPLDDVRAPAPGPAHPRPRPRPHPRLLRVAKSRDYERCERRPGFRRPSALANAPASLSTEEVIIRGSLSEYIVHSSTLTDKIVMEQSSFGQPQGLIESQLGIKLIRLKESHKPAAPLGTLRHVDLVYHEEDPFLPENFSISKRESSGTPDHESKPEDINDDIHYVHKRGKALVDLGDVSAQQRKQNGSSIVENKNTSLTPSKFHPLFNSSRPSGPPILPLVHSLQLIDQLSSNDSSPFAFPLELPPNIPIRPFFRGNSTMKLSDSERKVFARKLVQNISSALQDPNQMPDLHTLSSFSILVELLRTFSYNQLKNLTKNYEAARSSQNAVSEDDEFKWCAWRDAVGAAGSGPALLLLAAWASPGGLLAPAEAAPLISALPNVALRPDRAYAHRLFELVQAWERAAEGGAVHRAATLALAELLPLERRAPARVHGTAASFLLGTYVPHLHRQLRLAADRRDASAAQLYVRALGTAATPRALAAFQPYLEGERLAPALVRAQMVRALGPLARAHPRLVRRFLTPLLLNAREDEAVRAAAAGVVVLRARPPAAALRRLAHATRAEPSRRVVAALRSALHAAARSRHPLDAQLAANAQAALPFLQPAPLSAHYSRSWAATESSGGGGALRAEVDVLNDAESTVPDAVFADVYKSTDDDTLEEIVKASISFNSADFFYEQIMREVLDMDKENGGNVPGPVDESETKGKEIQSRHANGEETNGCDDEVTVGEDCGKRKENNGFAEEFKKHPDLGVFKSIYGNKKISLSECGLRNLEEYLIQSQQSQQNQEDGDEYGSDNSGQPEDTHEPGVDGNVSQTTEGGAEPTRDRARGPKATEGRDNWHNLCDYDPTVCDRQRARSGAGAEAGAEAGERRGFSNEQLRRLLGVRSRPAEPFAGHVAFQALGASYFVPFDVDFARHIADWALAEAGAARGPEGRRVRWARLSPGAPAAFYQASALGVAVFAVAEAPAAAAADGRFHLRPGAPAHLRLRLLYSQKTSYRFGFALPFENTLYSAGVERDLQFHLPVDLQLSASFAWQRSGEPQGAFAATLAPLRPRADERLLHYKVVPFISRQSALLPAPPLVGRHDVVRGRAPPQTEAVLGADSGVALRLAWTSEGRGAPGDAGAGSLALEALRSALPPWPFSQPLPTHFAQLDLRLDALRTHARAVHLAVAFGGGQDVGEDSLGGAGGLEEWLWANASLRFQGYGLPFFDAWAQYSARADGTATRLHAVFARGPSAHAPPFQVAARVDGRWADVPMTDFRKVLAADHSSYVTARVAYAWSPQLPPEKITVECRMSRSEARLQYLRRHPLAGVCLQEEAAGARLLPACRNITMRAGYLDQYLIDAQIPASLRDAARRGLAAARALGWRFAQPLAAARDASSGPAAGVLRARVAFKSGGLRAVDARAELGGDEGGVALSGVPVPSLLRPLLVVHPRYNAARRLARKVFVAENKPTCTVDVDAVNTFDNTTYPLHVGACWRVALRTVASADPRAPQVPHVTVLLREPRAGHREVQIVVDDRVVLMRSSPSGPGAGEGAAAPAELLVNGHRLPLPLFSLDNWVRAHALGGGGLLLDLPRAGVRALLDGRRLALVAGSGLRARVRGLCGTLAGRPREDFTAPEGCVLSSRDAFVRAWTLPGPACPAAARDAWEPCVEPRAAPVRLAPHATRAVLAPLSASASLSVSDSDYDSAAAAPLEAIRLPIPDDEARSASRETRLEPRTPLSTPLPVPPDFQCSRGRTRIFREGLRYCFSQRPLPECSPYCSPARLLRKTVPFVCAPFSKVTTYWAHKVMQGEDVDFSQREPNRWIVLSLPTRCV